MGAIAAGSLNRRVALLRRGPDTDNGSEEVPGEWQMLGWRSASIKPTRRGEGEEGEARTARREFSLWLRHDSLAPTLTAQDGLSIDGVLYEIVEQPVEIGFREGVELRAVSVDPRETVDTDTLDPWVAP